MNRADLQKLATERIADARALLAAKRWSGAYYLSGYAVESALKACFVVRLRTSDEFPDKRFSEQCWTHNLTHLMTLSSMKPSFDIAGLSDPQLLENWEIVRDWSEGSRYDVKSKTDAEDLYAAIADKKHGVLTWLKLHW